MPKRKPINLYSGPGYNAPSCQIAELAIARVNADTTMDLATKMDALDHLGRQIGKHMIRVAKKLRTKARQEAMDTLEQTRCSRER